MEAIKALAVSKIFRYLAGVLYIIGFIGLAVKQYIVAAVFIFVAVLLLLAGVGFDFIFIWKGIQVGKKTSKKSNV